jgi:hypothetical protein
MKSLIVVSLALTACMQVPPPMPNVGSSERVPSKTVHLRVAVEDLEGSPVAATETAVKLLSPSSFSARSREGGEVEVEVFLESEPQEQAASAAAPDRYLLTMKLSETSDRGQQVSWRPSLALTEDTESLSTVTWGSAGRRIRVTVSENELPIAVAAPTPAQPSTEAKVELAATAEASEADTALGTTASPEVMGESEAP